jgi:hypothetical protein
MPPWHPTGDRGVYYRDLSAEEVERKAADKQHYADDAPSATDAAVLDEAPRWPDCTCIYDCADDSDTACSQSGDWHTHGTSNSGQDGLGRCPLHPDAPGDW